MSIVSNSWNGCWRPTCGCLVYVTAAPCDIFVNPFSPTVFLTVAKMSRHTGRTHPSNFLDIRAEDWAPECPNVKKLKMVCQTSMALNALKCNHLTSLGLKWLRTPLRRHLTFSHHVIFDVSLPASLCLWHLRSSVILYLSCEGVKCDWVCRFLTAHQHIKGHLVPYKA